MKFKKIILTILKTVGIFLLLIIIYFLAAFGLTAITVNSDFKECEKDGVEIFIKTNGIHTDFILPYKNELYDWSKFVKANDTKGGDTSVVNVAFGWGDKGFYLKTKTWNDFKFSVAFKALFCMSTSAMHVTYYKKLSETESCKKVCITKTSYLKLVDFICKSFSANSDGVPQQIMGASYWNNDAFYEARGTYSLFFTCNTWTNCGLKKADMKACLWTPFDKGILKLYGIHKK